MNKVRKSEVNRKVLQAAKRVFLEAMLQGYASGAKAVMVPDMSGHKEFSYKGGNFVVKDRYCAHNPQVDGRSAGTTTIFFCNQPIWVMNYWGKYPKEVTPFLKLALLHQYKCGKFSGGRGPEIYQRSQELDGCSTYLNFVGKGSTFEDFFGHERVLVLNAEGFHRYSGMALV